MHGVKHKQNKERVSDFRERVKIKTLVGGGWGFKGDHMKGLCHLPRWTMLKKIARFSKSLFCMVKWLRGASSLPCGFIGKHGHKVIGLSMLLKYTLLPCIPFLLIIFHLSHVLIFDSFSWQVQRWSKLATEGEEDHEATTW